MGEAPERSGRFEVELEGVWLEYDGGNDILYVTFSSGEAEEEVLVEDGVVARVSGGKLLGLTIFDFSKRIQKEIF